MQDKNKQFTYYCSGILISAKKIPSAANSCLFHLMSLRLIQPENCILYRLNSLTSAPFSRVLLIALSSMVAVLPLRRGLPLNAKIFTQLSFFCMVNRGPDRHRGSSKRTQFHLAIHGVRQGSFFRRSHRERCKLAAQIFAYSAFSLLGYFVLFTYTIAFHLKKSNQT